MCVVYYDQETKHSYIYMCLCLSIEVVFLSIFHNFDWAKKIKKLLRWFVLVPLKYKHLN